MEVKSYNEKVVYNDVSLTVDSYGSANFPSYVSNPISCRAIGNEGYRWIICINANYVRVYNATNSTPAYAPNGTIIYCRVYYIDNT